MKKLTAKQEMFCKEYLIDLNGTQAAIRAGYSEGTAKEIASENLTKPNIQEYLTEIKAKREEKLSIDAQWVLAQAIYHHKQLSDRNENKDALKALDLIGRHINVKAFDKGVDLNQKVEHSVVADSDLARNLIFALQKAQENQ